MPSATTSPDYKLDRPRNKTAGSGGAQTRADDPAWRPADWATVEEFLRLLARAVRQFRTYPSTSPLCADAIAACQKVFTSLGGRQRLEIRIVPHELIIDEIGVGAGTIVEHELVHRLHRSHIASLDIDSGASPRDLSRFCGDVARCDDLARTKTTLAELLIEHGVDRGLRLATEQQLRHHAARADRALVPILAAWLNMDDRIPSSRCGRRSRIWANGRAAQDRAEASTWQGSVTT